MKKLITIFAITVILLNCNSIRIIHASESGPEYSYDSRYDTLAHKIIFAEPDIVPKKEAIIKLDIIIDHAKNALKRRDKYSQWQAEDIFRTIYMLLINSGYDYKENDFLSVGLINEKLDCDNYTVIYYSIAQVMHFPVYIVNLPKHSTLLWDEDGMHNPYDANNPQNKGDFYWETTLGEIRSDHDYIYSHKISKSSIEDGIFLNKISEDQVSAILCNYMAIREMEIKNYSEALKIINQSIVLDTKFPEAYNNRGIIFSKLKDFDNAIYNYDKAISLHPNFTLAYINKGIALEKTGKYQQAVQYYTDALNIESDFIMVYKLRSDANRRLGDINSAEKDSTVFNSLMK